MNSSERILNAVSTAELERRWAATRAFMREQNIDALVIQNSSDWVGGHIRWFTDRPAGNGYPTTAVFFLNAPMSIIEQGDFGGDRVLDPSNCFSRGIGRQLTTPSYPSIHYTGRYDAELAVKEIRRHGIRRVGLVAPSAMYYSFGAALKELLSDLMVVDATDAVDRLKAIKSAEEHDLICKTAAMQDAVMAKVREFIRPGLKEFEIAAYAQYVGQQLGSEQGIFLNSSAPWGEAAKFRPRSLQGRTLNKGDVFSFLIENNGAGGYYTELSRMFVLGKADSELHEVFARVLDAQTQALTLLQPGASCKEIFAAHNDYLRSLGMNEERRLDIHGMGYDMVERPLIRSDEEMTIAENMCIVVHPGVLNERMFVHNTQVYLIGKDGPGASIHHAPTGIVEIDC